MFFNSKISLRKIDFFKLERAPFNMKVKFINFINFPSSKPKKKEDKKEKKSYPFV